MGSPFLVVYSMVPRISLFIDYIKFLVKNDPNTYRWNNSIHGNIYVIIVKDTTKIDLTLLENTTVNIYSETLHH